jgi:hypothetical protein
MYTSLMVLIVLIGLTVFNKNKIAVLGLSYWARL